jgi:D-alanyl-D-alanine-carboxypeptidase/D-alanyl-D-alanine-endopeptidase
MRTTIIATAVLALSALLSRAAHADERALREALNLPAAALWLEYKAPGLILAVVRGGDAAVLGFGETAPGSGVEPNGRTIVRIGSLAKVFAGQLLADLSTEGKLRLADPAQRFLPEFKLPEAGGRPITLIDLATHTAGLPREVPGESAPGADPFERFSWANYKAYLATAALASAPGTAACYSNLGFGLLGRALEGASGQSYATLLQQRVTGPIGMPDTVLRLDAEQRTRLTTGHDFDGKPMPPYEASDAMAASGGLYATPDDMIAFMRWHLGRNNPDRASVRVVDHAIYLPRDGLSMVLGFDEAGRMDGLGLAWVAMMPEGPRPFILQKTGGIQGFLSYMALAPAHGVGVFVVANKFDFGAFGRMTAAANQLVVELAPR